MGCALQVQQQIKKSSAVKRTLARMFFAVGTAYINARRILDGVALDYAHTAPSMLKAMLATFTAAVLYPLYRCLPHTDASCNCSIAYRRHLRCTCITM